MLEITSGVDLRQCGYVLCIRPDNGYTEYTVVDLNTQEKLNGVLEIKVVAKLAIGNQFSTATIESYDGLPSLVDSWRKHNEPIARSWRGSDGDRTTLVVDELEWLKVDTAAKRIEIKRKPNPIARAA